MWLLVTHRARHHHWYHHNEKKSSDENVMDCLLWAKENYVSKICMHSALLIQNVTMLKSIIILLNRDYTHTHYNTGLDKTKCVKGFHKTAVHSQHLSRNSSRRARTKYNCEKEKIKKGQKHRRTDPFQSCDVFERFWRRLNLWVVCSPGAVRAIVTDDPIWHAAGGWNQRSSFHERSEHIC